MGKPMFARLPTSEPERIAVLVERSSPSPDRPRLSIDAESRLEEIERRSAQCYAVIENITDRFGRLAEQIATEGDGVPEELDDADSTVFHIEKARTPGV